MTMGRERERENDGENDGDDVNGGDDEWSCCWGF